MSDSYKRGPTRFRLRHLADGGVELAMPAKAQELDLDARLALAAMLLNGEEGSSAELERKAERKARKNPGEASFSVCELPGRACRLTLEARLIQLERGEKLALSSILAELESKKEAKAKRKRDAEARRKAFGGGLGRRKAA